MRIEDKKVEPDTLSWVKFSGISWTNDSKGFFYSRYPAPKEGENLDAGTETNANLDHQLYYHFLGTDQSENILCWENPENPQYTLGASVTEDGKLKPICSNLTMLLKILSKTEKQLRASKNQTTWLTVALLQLSSAPSFNANDSSLCVRSIQPRGSGASADESLKYLVVSQCGQNRGCESEKLKDKVALESIWNRAVTPDDASKLFHVSRENGLAVVLVTVKEHAEFYAQMMACKGLRSTIEPDSTTL